MKKIKAIILRVDFGVEIGFAHIIRCLEIYNVIVNNGNKAYFLVKHFDSSFLDVLPKSITFKITQENEVLEYASKLKVKTIIYDISHKLVMNEVGLENIKTVIYHLNKSKVNTIMFDGITAKDSIQQNISTLVNYLIVPYLNVNKKLYLTTEGTVFLTGLKYFIFRENIFKLLKSSQYIKKIGILISIGGSDHFNITTKILKFLFRTNYKITVIIGPKFKYNNIKEIIFYKQFKNINIFYNPQNIYHLIKKSKLLITSTGLTKYEALMLGTTSVIVANNNDMKEAHKNLDKYGIYYFGKVVDCKLFKNYILQKYRTSINKKLNNYDGIEELYNIIKKKETCHEK